MTKKSALVFGASGLVGTELLKLLLDHPEYESVVSFGRRKLNRDDSKLKQVIADFDDLKNHQDLFVGRDIFCCLGTTIKKAKTKEAFRMVDFQYVLEIAELASKNQAENFAVVSSIGADENSGNFYLKTKGEMEAALRQLNFKSLTILRPSILLGKRTEKRLGEKIGKVVVQIFSPLLIGGLKKYRGVHASKVAQKMIDATLKPKTGIFIIESDQI